MPATNFQTLLNEGRCFSCFGELSVPQILELALLRRIVLNADPAAATDPQSLMTYGVCYACPGASEFEIMKISMLDMLSQA